MVCVVDLESFMINIVSQSFSKKSSKFFILSSYVLLSFLLFFLVRDVETSQDYHNYAAWYEAAIYYNLLDNFLLLKDPSFVLLSNISSFFNGGVYVVIFTLVSISIISKAFLLTRFENSIIVTFCFLYLCKFFFTLELTQFRSAAAIGLAILSLVFYIEKRWMLSMFILLFALTIHLSAMLILLSIPIAFLVKQVKYEQIIVLSFMFLLFLGVLFPIDLNSFVFLDFIGKRINPYLDNSYNVTSLSLINFYFLIKVTLLSVFCAWFFLTRTRSIQEYNAYFLQLFFYLSCLGTLLFVVFRLNDAIALRLSEFYSVFDLLFLSFLSKSIANEWVGIYRFFLLLLCGIFLYSSFRLIS